MFAIKNQEHLSALGASASKVLDALNLHYYRISYKYNSEEESITYCALLKDSNLDDLPSFICCTINSDGSFVESTNAYDYVLYRYIYSKEKALTHEELETLYAPIKDSVLSLENLSSEELKERQESRTSFDSFIESLNLLETNNQATKNIHITPFLFFEYQYRLSFTISSPSSRPYTITSLRTLINCIKTNSYHRYGKELEFKHDLKSFDDSSQKLYKFIDEKYSDKYYYDVKDLQLTESDVYDLFNIYRGNKILFNNSPYFIQEDDIILNLSIEDDELKIIPPISLTKGLFLKDDTGFIINKNNFEIELLKFNDPLVGKLANYLLDHPKFSLKHVDDMFANKVLPLIEDKITVSKTYSERHKTTAFNIDLYLDLTSADTLMIHTIYHEGTKQIFKEDALNNLTYRSKIENYLHELSLLHIQEEDEVVDQDIITNILFNPLDDLKRYCTIMLSENLKDMTTTKVAPFNINATYNMDWLEVSITSKEYTAEEINDILMAYHKKKKFYRLNKSFIYLDDDIMSSLEDIKKDFEIDDSLLNHKEIPLYNIFKLPSYQGNNINLDNKIKGIINDIADFKNHDIDLNNDIHSKLRPYQEDGVKWLSTLYENKLGGILGDDMGLGKTLEMIAFIASKNIAKPVLIVSPKSLIYNWRAEFRKWNPHQRVKVITGSKEERKQMINLATKIDHNVLIVSYDTLRNDIDIFKDIEYGLILLDEAQYIKNAHAQKTKAVKELKSEYRFVLTGTPIENSLYDLWSIFDFIMPGYLLSYESFTRSYVTPINEEGDQEVKKRLVSKIAPFILRRTKKEVLKDLPPKIETVYTVSMVDEQRKLYDAYLQQTKIEAAKGSRNKINTLALLTRLRQICVDPSMFIDNFKETSDKLLAVIDYIKEAIANQHKILVFSSFTMSLDHLQELLKAEDISSFYISGKVSAKERLEICDKFNDENDPTPVVLVSLKAGNTGLNLIGGDIVIHLDPWWNVAAENQASDRAHRIGQKNTVNVIKMVCENSIEEKVIKLQEIKTRLTQDFISDNDESITSLSDEDISYLLS